MKLHLHQFLSRSGAFGTKREIYEAISRSEIKVGGEVITSPMHRFNPKKHNVYWRGRLLKYIDRKVYLLVNKPAGYLSTRLSDADRRMAKRSIFELLDEDPMEDALKNTLFCVGRLDEDTSGLIIMTNDGPLGYRIASPDSHIEKTYEVSLENPLTDDQAAKICNGVTIEVPIDGNMVKYRTRPAKVTLLEPGRCRITIDEGKKREVRLIFEAVGNKVRSLKRISIGDMKLEGLDIPEGKYVEKDKEFLLRGIGHARKAGGPHTGNGASH